MRASSTTLRDALTGAFNARWVADVFYDGQRRLQDVDILEPQFTDDGSANIQGTGSVTVLWSDDFASKIAPEDIGDLFSPFGTQMLMSVLVSVGDGFVERIPFGTFLVDDTPEIREQRMAFLGGYISRGERIKLSLKDQFYGIDRDRFDAPGGPASLASVWSEVQRLAQLPVTRSAVADAGIPAAIAYEENKLAAIYDLADSLDAVAYMTADGTISMRPNVWPAVVDTIRDGREGTLLDVGRAMSSASVYNKVVIRTDAADGTVILATAEITSGPLRTANADGSLSPYRRVPYFYSSPFITTVEQARAYAPVLLDQVSKRRAVQVPVDEVFNPLREAGDVVSVVRAGRATFTGRVIKVERSGTATQTTTLAVNL